MVAYPNIHDEIDHGFKKGRPLPFFSVPSAEGKRNASLPFFHFADPPIAWLKGLVTFSFVWTSLAIAAGDPPAEGMMLWLRADRGVTLEGAAVTAWIDQVKGERKATPYDNEKSPSPSSDPKFAPVLVEKALNGRPVVRFDGQDDLLILKPLAVNGLEEMTIAMVAANTAYETGGYGGVDEGGRYGNSNALFSWRDGGGWGSIILSPFQASVVAHFGTGQKGENGYWKRPASVKDAFTLTLSIKDGGSGTDSLYVAGEHVRDIKGREPAVDNTKPEVWIGRGDGEKTYYTGDLAEVIVYRRALPDPDREKLEAYFNEKYFGTKPLKAPSGLEAKPVP